MKSRIFFSIICFLAGFCGILYFHHQTAPKSLITVPTKTFSTPMEKDSFTVHNCSRRHDLTGERWLGQDIMTTLSRFYPNAHHLFIDDQKGYFPDTEINIYLRGYFKFSPPFPNKDHINIAYVIYPLYHTRPNAKVRALRDRLDVPEYTMVFYDELQFYDALAVGSKSYTEKLQQAGFNAYYVPQFTNTAHFYPSPSEDLKSEILFVGAYAPYRNSPKIAYKHNLPITIYGPYWSDGMSRQEYINNKKLHKYYSSAKIVLNETRPDMKEYGFIPNRIFDASACGTLVISDYIPAIEEAYGDTVPMYKTEEELVNLLNYYLDPAHEEERQDKARRAREITLQNFTSDIVARQFDTIIKDLKAGK
jgi:glycosyltransferase involved in cell wall biosynthesis